MLREVFFTGMAAMRERLPQDWKVDLVQRHSLEARVRNEIAAHPDLVLLSCSTSSTERLDYQVVGPGARMLQIELKAKRQSYVGWARYRPGVDEKDVFILDELALRKLIDAGRYGFLLVHDMPGHRWAVWSNPDLVLTPKARVSRQLAVGSGAVKGKVLISFSDDAHLFQDLVHAIDFIAGISELVDARWTDIAPWPTPSRATAHQGAS
jgi:hypothetical protein